MGTTSIPYLDDLWYYRGMEVSVREAARQLRLSSRRVRALAAAGRIPARRIDERTWVVDIDAARRRPYDRRASGRPLSPRSCWAILAVAEGREPLGLSASERARARARAAVLAEAAPGSLAGRAALHRLTGHRGVLERLADDGRLVLGGASAAQRHGADVIALEYVEAYVRDDDLGPIVAAYAMQPAIAGAENTLLRVPAPGWPFPPEARVAPAPVVAADLIDAGDERSVRAGRALLRRIVAEGTSP